MAWLYEPKDKTAKEYLFPIHSEDTMMHGFTYQHIIDTFNASEPVKTEKKLKDFIRSQIEMVVREMWENYNLCREKILEECGIPMKYTEIVRKIGITKITELIPFTYGELEKAYEVDADFNNLPLKEWDRAAGFMESGRKLYFIGSPLRRMCSSVGVTYSCATGVCILKEAARIWIETNRRLNRMWFE